MRQTGTEIQVFGLKFVFVMKTDALQLDTGGIHSK
jgi:hypothetical protein